MPDHTITASAGSGGSISPSGAVTVTDGGSQSFTATPSSVNFEVNEWLLDGSSVQEGGNSYGISGVVANHTVQVTFSSIVSFTKSSDAVIVAPKRIGQRMPIPPMATWKYLKTNSPPSGWETIAFDDSGWSSGPAPFGDPATGCTLPEPIGTSWDGSTDILLRYEFYWPVSETVDNFIVGFSGYLPVNGMYWNDTLFTGLDFLNHSCPNFVPSDPHAPPNDILFTGKITNAGVNLMAVHVQGFASQSWFDMTGWTIFDPPITSDAYIVAPKTFTLTSDAYIVGGKTVILLSDAVIASPAVDFTLTSDAVIVAPTTFTLTSDAVIRRPPLPPGQQNLLSKYLQQQRDALLEKPCTTCAPIDCVDSAGLGYSLESPEFPTVFVCPEGFDCNLIGEDFHLICCDGTVYDLHFSPQISQEDRKRVVDSAIAECARKLAFCNIDPCPTPPCINIWLYWNNAISCTERCPTSNNTFRWTVPAGVYLAFTQEAADQTAGRAACQLAKLHRICFSDLQSTTCIGETYDDEIIISGRFVAAYPNSDTISIVDGALPDGLTLNDGSSFVTGGRVPIRGTPTVGGSFTFTVSIVLGTLNDGYGDTQTRTYTIKVAQVKPDDLPDATIGVAYSQNLSVLPDHDQETEEWSVVTSLPAGLTLTKSGVLHGTPTGPSESHNVTVRVSFILDDEQTFCTKQWTLTVNEGCNEQTLVPYQDSGWKYLQIGVDTDPPSNYETVAFDDSGWSTGKAAFGEGPEVGTPCPLIATVHTAWTRDTRLVLRKHITMAAGTKSVRLRFAVDNDVLAVWFNGVLLGSDLHHDFCPSLPNFEKLADNGTVIAGDNVVAVLCRDHYLTPIPNGDQSFFDLSVVACVP